MVPLWPVRRGPALRQMRHPVRLAWHSAGRANPVAWKVDNGDSGGRETMTMLLTERWPQLTAEAADSASSASEGAGGNRETAQELLAEMAALIRDTRPYLIVSSAVAAAVLIGLAVESTTLPAGRPGPGAVAVTALFAVVALCLLRTLALIAAAGLPLVHVLSQQRVAAGAPL